MPALTQLSTFVHPTYSGLACLPFLPRVMLAKRQKGNKGNYPFLALPHQHAHIFIVNSEPPSPPAVDSKWNSECLSVKHLNFKYWKDAPQISITQKPSTKTKTTTEKKLR